VRKQGRWECGWRAASPRGGGVRGEERRPSGSASGWGSLASGGTGATQQLRHRAHRAAVPPSPPSPPSSCATEQLCHRAHRATASPNSCATEPSELGAGLATEATEQPCHPAHRAHRAAAPPSNCATEPTEQLRHQTAAPPSPASRCATEQLRSEGLSFCQQGEGQVGSVSLASSRPRVLASSRPVSRPERGGSPRPPSPPCPGTPPLAPSGTAPLLPPDPDPNDSRPSSAAAPRVPTRVIGTRRTPPAPRARDHP